jgi:DNA-binding Xre family transcriptional regulator
MSVRKRDYSHLRLVFCRDESDPAPGKKYENNLSTCFTPGLRVSPLAIFSSVRRGTPLPTETAHQLPLALSSSTKTRSNMDSFMVTNSKPIYGFIQPADGLKARVRLPDMARGPKSKKAPSVSRNVVSDNIVVRMQSTFSGSNDKPLALAKSSHLTKSTIQRVISGEVSATIDTLAAIAEAFECSIADLVTPSERTMRALGVSRAVSASTASVLHERPAPTYLTSTKKRGN